MKTISIIIITGCLFAWQQTNAQDLSALKAPVSPAFSILGFEPAAVMRPTNAKELATDVLTSFDKDGKLLMNLGLEVSPYWLKSNPNLTRAQYIKPSVGQAFLQSFSLSGATVKDSASGSNKLGAGFRFSLYNGEPTDAYVAANAAINSRTTLMAIVNGFKALVSAGTFATKKAVTDAVVVALNKKNLPAELITGFSERADSLAADYPETSAGIKAYLQKLIDTQELANRALAQEVSDLIYDRKGFVLEFAGASGFNTTQKNNLENIGLWCNASYYVSPNDLFTLTARYMRRNSDSSISNFDLGIGFLKKNDKYNIAFEGLMRYYQAAIPDFNSANQPIKRLEKDFAYRFALQGSYNINKDISINLSFGKDFNSPFISRSGIFSILGLNYSIFSKLPAALK